MASGVAAWSQTAASNNTADSNINWQEGQAPSTINDSARAMMASVAKWRDDNAGSLVTAGTSTAYTLTSNQGFASLAAMAGQTIRAKVHADCGATPTLNVDGLGAKFIISWSGLAVTSGQLRNGAIYGFVYDNSLAQWIIVGGEPGAFPSGTLMLFQQTAAPAGWTKQTTHNDKALRVVSGTAGSGGTTAFTAVMTARPISQANLPNYTLPNTFAISDATHQNGVPSGTVNGSGALRSDVQRSSTTLTDFNVANITLTGSVTSGGSDSPMNFAVTYVDVIIAMKN